MGTVHRHPETDAAIGVAPEILALVTIAKPFGGDQGCGIDGGNREVPRGEVYHFMSLLLDIGQQFVHADIEKVPMEPTGGAGRILAL
ncbi:hypothetical protein D3C80_2067590 [compost metagenome]